MPGKVVKEGKSHKEAFELYYAMGDKRSYVRVAQALGLHERTVTLWGSTFHWKDKVLVRDAFITDAMERELGDRLKQTKVQVVSMIRLMLEDAMKMHKDGITVKGARIRAFDVADIERLIKTYSLMTGGATERKDVIVGGVLRVPTTQSAEQWEKDTPQLAGDPNHN